MTLSKLGLGLLLMGLSFQAAALECRLTQNQFIVRGQKSEHQIDLASTKWRPKIACLPQIAAVYDGTHLFVVSASDGLLHWRATHSYPAALLRLDGARAVLYDGNEFIIFTNGLGFQSFSVATKFHEAQLVVNRQMAAIYDGKFLSIFDASRADLTTFSVASRFKHSRLLISGGLLLFYDGKEIHVWDRRRGDYFHQRVSPLFYFTAYSFGPGTVAFYDGKSVVGFCSRTRSLVSEPVIFDPFAKGRVDPRTGEASIKVADKIYRLSWRKCEWSIETVE